MQSLVFLFGILVIIGFWGTFVKAGFPGWTALIPVYNLFVLVKIAKKPKWWIFLLFISYLNLVFFALISLEIAYKFKKSPYFAMGLILLPFVFYLKLGFDDSKYIPDATFSSKDEYLEGVSLVTLSAALGVLFFLPVVLLYAGQNFYRIFQEFNLETPFFTEFALSGFGIFFIIFIILLLCAKEALSNKKLTTAINVIVIFLVPVSFLVLFIIAMFLPIFRLTEIV